MIIEMGDLCTLVYIYDNLTVLNACEREIDRAQIEHRFDIECLTVGLDENPTML